MSRRAHPQQRREAKLARRNRRLSKGGASRRQSTERQHIAKVILGEQNLAGLVQRAAVVADNRLREAEGKGPKKPPKLTHYRDRLHGDLVESVID